MSPNPRPTRLTEDMKLAAAAELVGDLIKEHHLDEQQRAGAIADIARHASSSMDGYEIAKTLDDRCYWSCDLEMAEALDGYSHIAHKHLAAAQLAWFEAEKPTAPAEPGQRIEFKWGGKAHTGTVDEIYAHGAAQFTVKVDGDEAADTSSQRRAIVNWEDCRPISTDAPA